MSFNHRNWFIFNMQIPGSPKSPFTYVNFVKCEWCLPNPFLMSQGKYWNLATSIWVMHTEHLTPCCWGRSMWNMGAGSIITTWHAYPLYFRVLYGQICHLADEYLILTQRVLKQNSTTYTTLTFLALLQWENHISVSCDLQFPPQHWRLIDFAMVESCSIITSNCMFLLTCQCFHVLYLILDRTIKQVPTLSFLWEQ